MAMIDCKECGNPVSAQASKCPSCGIVLKKPKRGIIGKLIKWTFILFNLLMIAWLVSFFVSAGEVVATSASEAEQAGAALGATLGTGMILFIWGFGDIILGLLVLLTRPKS